MPSLTLNLGLGTLVIATRVVIHTFGLIAITRMMSWMVAHFRMHGHRSRVVAMITVVIGLFGVLTVEVWLWAGVYLIIGALPDLETSLYFSTSAFSTVGFGDVVIGRDWRLLSALESANGFLLIGWSTAYLIAASTRVGPFRTGEHF